MSEHHEMEPDAVVSEQKSEPIMAIGDIGLVISKEETAVLFAVVTSHISLMKRDRNESRSELARQAIDGEIERLERLRMRLLIAMGGTP